MTHFSIEISTLQQFEQLLTILREHDVKQYKLGEMDICFDVDKQVQAEKQKEMEEYLKQIDRPLTQEEMLLNPYKGLESLDNQTEG
jgi:hypothetical protein